MYELNPFPINLKNSEERFEVDKFLRKNTLYLEEDVDYTIIIKQKQEIVATASKAGDIFKCIAVSTDFRGEGITAALINMLLDKLFQEGKQNSFIFTKPENKDIFQSIGYKLIYSVKEVALLENGIYNINKYISDVIDKYNISSAGKGALVMNCNPFTKGHRYLIEKASEEEEEVIVFVVEEDKSLFPFDVRYSLVKEGTKDLKNVKVIPGGKYIISSSTFPGYFLRKEAEVLNAQASLDVGIFGSYFARGFNIKRRYVGEEPYCNVTRLYNKILSEVLPTFGVELKILSRLRNNYDYISASIVRNFIKCDKLEEIENMLPEVTWKFINSPKGKEIAENIRHSSSPH